MNMQFLRISLRAFIIFFSLLTLSSCSKFLDVAPKDQVSDATLWSTTGNADLFLNDVYASVPTLETGDPWENFSDNSMNGQAGRVSTNIYGPSIYTPSNAPNRWGQYVNIRKANLFIEKVTASALPDDWKALRLAEARFLRAYFYSILWMYHGGVPIITDVLNQNEQGDEVFRPRNTSQETFDFITAECAAIEPALPLTAESGRVTRGAVLALKGWCELFNAGALHNPANDPARWDLAATTFKKIIDLEHYDLFPDYNTLFFEENNNNIEVIFARQHLGGTSLANFRDGHIGPRFVRGGLTGWGHVDPTQDLVDEYFMANGLPITDPASGYDPQNPYVNREKRFYQSIVYDGSEWLGDIMIMKQGVGSPNATDLNNSSISTRTGYYIRKGINPKYASAQNNGNSANWIIFRYAEILLGYAEAKNESSGPDETVYSAINDIRQRSDLGPLPDGLTKDEMRIAIHQERRVELAFEEKRLPDLLRLRLAEVKLNGPLHAIKIDLVGGNPVYTVVPAGGGMRVFYPEKNYFLPIPQSARDKNSKLEQNPHYD
ncbi:RagB/SusD family nutrient uptake outer membrane protein [Chitinophaga sp. XS-30]|uniref:RagB/SusD family nutrient uptake outer membrane protein n=1 Tax=Chitinophaga sp. XS-30 TaxID=2604421 RepID=UPI0011DD405F|nr:RagB/SusD family nutrient uptake outer membrane protein [Chitinophaga sp. XS-30]QEH42739.1 RagB/SusD family nutrient uptake outer membrane protein [Chitinophaga sp. XS-30]